MLETVDVLVGGLCNCFIVSQLDRTTHLSWASTSLLLVLHQADDAKMKGIIAFCICLVDVIMRHAQLSGMGISG